jgi:hypothetical protein
VKPLEEVNKRVASGVANGSRRVASGYSVVAGNRLHRRQRVMIDAQKAARFDHTAASPAGSPLAPGGLAPLWMNHRLRA